MQQRTMMNESAQHENANRHDSVGQVVHGFKSSPLTCKNCVVGITVLTATGFVNGDH